jgi:hypothetical protein
MWNLILGFLGGPLVSGLLDAYRARLDAAAKQDVLAVDLAKKEIEAEIAARAEANKIIIAEQGRWYTAIIRPLFALPFIIFAWKVVVCDKVLGWGVTDALDPNMWSVFIAVVTAYFGGRSLEKIARVFRNR